MAASGDTGAEKVILFSTLSFLQLIKDAQQQHGLRHGDYQRYRAYCARRIRRLRKSLHFKHGHKSVPKHPAKFVPKKLSLEMVTESRYLLVPMWEAERCWAYGMQLKQEMSAEEAGRKKFHLLSKFRKALQHSTQLENLCRSLPNVDAPTKLEAQAYNAWMTGCLHFETQDWHKAMDAFNAAKTIYEKLSSVVGESGVGELYRGRCAEMQPQLRFCAYNIGDESAMDDLRRLRIGQEEGVTSDLDKLIAQTLERQTKEEKAEVKWGGVTVSLQTPEKVHSFHSALKEFTRDLQETQDPDAKLALYEKLLIECRDAIQAIRDETKNENLKAKRGKESWESEAALVHGFLTFVRLSRTVDRYLILIDQTKKPAKPADLVRLYDTVLQNVSEALCLSGVEKDQMLKMDLEAQLAYFKAFRCYYVAEAYASLRKWPETLALYERTLQYIADARNRVQNDITNNQMISTVKLDELVDWVNSAKYGAHAQSMFATDEDAVKPSNQTLDKTLREDLRSYREWSEGEFRSVGGLVRLPPEFRPMPCKPLFFDLALNHVQIPSLAAHLEAGAPSPSQAEPRGQGLTGMVKGWFWGSGKG